jgi:DNA replication protein DnaC
MTDVSISEVFIKYERIRANNQAEEQRRRKEVYRKIPELINTHQKINELQKKRIFNVLSGNDEQTQEIALLRKKVSDLLLDAGYSSDYLDSICLCSICRDTGLRDDSNHCDCFKKMLLEYKLNEARLLDNNISFEQFDLNIFDVTLIENGKSQREIMNKIKQLAEQYANGFPNISPILLLAGSTGLGKTYISKCIMRRVIERGYTAAYYTSYSIFSLFHRDRLGENVDLSPIFEVPLLIIDDFGTEPMTRNVTIEYFFDLINERNRLELRTIIITNLGFHEIKEFYGDRIHSRLMDVKTSQKIIFKGKDIRYT